MPLVTIPRLLPYRMTALYICECIAAGRCEGWLVNNGLVYKPGAAGRLGEWRPCRLALEAWEAVGRDPEAYRMIALLDYAARHGLDPRALPGYKPSKAEAAAEAHRIVSASLEARVLAPLLL